MQFLHLRALFFGGNALLYTAYAVLTAIAHTMASMSAQVDSRAVFGDNVDYKRPPGTSFGVGIQNQLQIRMRTNDLHRTGLLR